MARTTLEQADKETAPNLMRRKCAIFILQARVYLKQREYEGAALMANSALGLASTINAFPSMSQVAAIHGELSTKWKASDEVMELGDALTTAVGGVRGWCFLLLYRKVLQGTVKDPVADLVARSFSLNQASM